MSLIQLDRTCYELDDKGERIKPESNMPVTALLAMPAWVLLGEPGMGKSKTFKSLDEKGTIWAQAITGKYRDELGTTLLVDGLDETLDKTVVRDRIKALHREAEFASIGISSRYADWFHKHDQKFFEEVLGAIRVFVLEPLNESQTFELATHLLLDAKSSQTAEDFLQQATQRKLADLLGNPKLLEMLITAIKRSKGDAWPTSRSEVYELACEQLLYEENDAKVKLQFEAKNVQLDLSNNLHEAGELCAIYLISNSVEIQTRKTRLAASERVMLIPTLPNDEKSKALWNELVKTRLFLKTREYTFKPNHRTVAEYLAARYLAKRLSDGLSVERLCAWLLAQDGGIVKNLRGLTGWLAALTTDPNAQQRLYEADVWAVLNYGDLTLLDAGAKTRLLKALEENPAHGYVPPEAIGNCVPLVDSDMTECVSKYLDAPGRDKSATAMTDLLCTTLSYSHNASQLRASLEVIVSDATRADFTRRRAMWALIRAHENNPSALLPWLDAVRTGSIKDANYDLRGELLLVLYPRVITHAHVFRYCITTEYWGAYKLFCRVLGNPNGKHTNIEIEALANAFVNWLETSYAQAPESQHYKCPVGLNGLLPSAIVQVGETVSAKVLNNWLWHYEPPNHYPQPPQGEDLMHAAARTWVSEHRDLVVQAVQHGKASKKYPYWWNRPSVEKNTEESDEIKEINRERALRETAQNQKITDYMDQLKAKTSQIKNATDIGGLTRIAFLYAQKQGERYGLDAPLDAYLAEALNNDDALRQAAEDGMKHCLELLADAAVIEAFLANKSHQTLQLMIPALIGIDLLYNEDTRVLDKLSDVQIQVLVIFYVTSGFSEKAWFTHLLNTRSGLVAKQWELLVLAQVKNNGTYQTKLYEVANTPAYNQIAKLMLLNVLKQYPIKLTQAQMLEFGVLLVGCMKHFTATELLPVLELRLNKKSINVAQKAYLWIVGYFLNPSQFESHIETLLSNAHLHTFGLEKLFDQAGFSQKSHVFKFDKLAVQHHGLLIRLFFLIDDLHYWRYIEPVLVNLNERHKADVQSIQMLQSLVEDESLLRYRSHLQQVLEHQTEIVREAHFKPATDKQIADALANKAPANLNDLLAITLDCLKGYQAEIKTSPQAITDFFWDFDSNRKGAKPIAPRSEELARDQIVQYLKPQLKPLGINVKTEEREHKDKRSDIRIDYRPHFSLPIEVKGDWHPSLWTAPELQLAKFYINNTEGNGLGIYLVLWTGVMAKMQSTFHNAFPNGIRPDNLENFKQQMTAHIKNNPNCKGIELFVLDISK